MTATPEDLDVLLQRAFRYALALAHDRAVAEELLQEACLRVSKRGGPWHIGYLMTVMRNHLIDLRRRDGVVAFEELSDEQGVQGDRVMDRAPDLEWALRHLDTANREVLFLAAVEGYTAAEIAAATDRPRGTVLSMLHRTKKKLRELLSRSERGTRS